jgi:hypothetical protein
MNKAFYGNSVNKTTEIGKNRANSDSPYEYDCTEYDCDDYDDFDDEAEEERERMLDEIFRLRKGNQRKMLAPYYIIQIVQNNTDYDHPMSQAELQRRLEKDYELILDRKAVKRDVDLLFNEGLGVYSHPKKGVWFDPYGRCA